MLIAALSVDRARAEPGIEITSVPPCGVDAEVVGQVAGVDPADFVVALYIDVGGGWWTKPTFAEPTVPIDPDGSWVADYVSHPNDLQADRILAVLIPDDLAPPQADGGWMLDGELFAHPNDQRTRGCVSTHLEFSGASWLVKDSGGFPVGPGPNLFSDDPRNVRVEADGSLHLTITNRDGQWQAAEVIHASPDPGLLGHGTYRFQVRAALDDFDVNVVLGLFTWDSFAPTENYREIDVEASRWGEPADPTNAQYVVQPYSAQGNLRRFAVGPGVATTTHAFTWRADTIHFQSWHGAASEPPTPSSLIDSWLYTGPDVPAEGGENARINLWLVWGARPTDGREVEVEIERFEFVPVEGDLPGQVPDGATWPGEPLRIAKSTRVAGALDLSWGAGCGGAIDYAVYEGTLGAWDSHDPRECATGGNTFATISPRAGDRYFLAVPLSTTAEGGYGVDSTGTPRPGSTSPCRALRDLGDCFLPD
jgi:hypothetical protein